MKPPGRVWLKLQIDIVQMRRGLYVYMKDDERKRDDEANSTLSDNSRQIPTGERRTRVLKCNWIFFLICMHDEFIIQPLIGTPQHELLKSTHIQSVLRCRIIKMYSAVNI